MYAYWGNIFLEMGFIIFFGYFCDKYLLTKLYRAAKRTSWECDDIILLTLRGRVSRWSILLAVYLLSEAVPMTQETAAMVRNGALAFFILSVTCMLSEIATAIINVYSKRSTKIFPSISIFTNLTSSLLFIFGIILILQSFGISVAPLITALGIGGVAVALALQDTLSNFFAGLHLLLSRPVRPGDYIRLDTGEEGYVMDITWRNTSIQDLMQNMVIIPNSKMTEAKIINYNLPEKRITILIPLSVNFDSDLERVEQITLEIASAVMREANGGVGDFQPAVRFHSFGEFSVDFNVMLCVRQFSAQYYIRHEFIKQLQRRFIVEAIDLPESMYTIKIK